MIDFSIHLLCLQRKNRFVIAILQNKKIFILQLKKQSFAVPANPSPTNSVKVIVHDLRGVLQNSMHNMFISYREGLFFLLKSFRNFRNL